MEGWGGGSERVSHCAERGGGGKSKGENLLHEIRKKRKTATSVRELQTAFERQNVIPFGILWVGKQPGFILEVSWRVCVCVFRGGVLCRGWGTVRAGIRERERE